MVEGFPRRPVSEESGLVPAVIARDDDADDDDDCSTPVGRMEIVIAAGWLVIVDANVDAVALARPLDVMDRR